MNIEQLAKETLYTVYGNPYWEAAGYREFAMKIIEHAAQSVEHVQLSGGGNMGDTIRNLFVWSR
jgi:exopolysaccharide biosynthesis predicted pyruvyltransferase EpsI